MNQSNTALRLPCRTILDIPETRADFWEFFKRHWGPLLAAGKLRVALFSGSANE